MSNLTADENKLVDECYELAERLVRTAGKLVKEGYSKAIEDVEVKEKVAKWDVVTEYDRKVEEFLISQIKINYPEHR